eukprot:jgi/Astpho2/3698/Aster-04887
MAALGWQHGSRLQLQAGPGVFTMLRAEPLLAAHVSEARLPWGARAGSSSMDQVSSLSSLTKLTLFNRDSVLGEAGKLDALRQLSALQSLDCQGDVMQTLLAKSVPRSWSLLTELQLCTFRAPDWSLVEQQCPQLQALATHEAIPLCLTALTSLTSHFWLPQHTDSFQCSRLSHLHGFPKVQAECAVQATQGASIEAALLWIESHQNFDLLSSAAAPVSPSVRENAAGQAAMLASQMADLLSSTQAPTVLPEADCKARTGKSSLCLWPVFGTFVVLVPELGMSLSKDLVVREAQLLLDLCSCIHVAPSVNQASAPAVPLNTIGLLQVVFVVAGDLGMSPGKLAAQVAHAAVGLHRVLLEGRYPWLPAWEASSDFA